jgi:predicted hotdog family 3-hydroxylacyl-ACP dehydratase
MLPVKGDILIELIPQKPPFVLISELHEVTENHCITVFNFDNSHVLCNDNTLTVAGLIENIAQTCAVKVGYECSLVNKKVPLGFIGDVKDFRFTRLPVVGETIRTEIIIDHRIFDVTIISGKIWVDDEEIAGCKMKIFVEPEKEKVTEAYVNK